MGMSFLFWHACEFVLFICTQFPRLTRPPARLSLLCWWPSKGIGHGFENAWHWKLDSGPVEFVTTVHLKKSALYLVLFSNKVCFLVIYFQCSAFHAAATKEWWNVGASGQARTFEGEPPCPFKTDARSPFLDVPGGGTTCIKTDLMHTFNLGVGGDLSASSIIALCNLGQFRGRGLPSRLDHAYETFACWCKLNKKTVSTKSFEKKKFHMKSFLGETSILLSFLFLWEIGHFGVRF